MRPVSGAALAVAALLTSPALSSAATGGLPVDVALTRYLLAAGLCWVLLTVAEEWLWPAAGPASAPAAADEASREVLDGDPDPDPPSASDPLSVPGSGEPGQESAGPDLGAA